MALEANRVWKMTVLCEPQLGKRGLYSDLGLSGGLKSDRSLTNLIAYLDGELDLLEVAEIVGMNILDCFKIVQVLARQGLVEEIVDG
jgi:aminopeptidase-like protein